MSRLRDVVVVGGGPAGLALATAAAARGLDVVVLERRAWPVDKACGEGLLPAGRRALAALGALASIDPAGSWPLRELRWCEPGGPAVALRLPGEGGVGIRRTVLSAALRARAAAAGAELRLAEVTGHARSRERIAALVRGGEPVEARVLVAADGLASPVRRREGLDVAVAGSDRFGLRRHFAVEPWAEAVEVHFGCGVEAYVTPVARRRVGIAFLFRRGHPGGPDRLRFEDLLARFPALEARLAGAPVDSAPRGAGPLERRSRARVVDRLVLLGDAAGYLDAVTGDGLSLALGCAADLAALLPGALARGAGAAALGGYEAAWRRRWRVYSAWTRLVLLLASRPALRRGILRLAAARPTPFERLVAAAVG